jgi:Uma2 family endonuclease
MVLEVSPRSPAKRPLQITWEPLPADYVLPDDPVENIQQPLLAAALTDALSEAGLITPQMLIASNFGLVATVDQKTVVKAPDWLYIPQVTPVREGLVRRSYTPQAEGDAVAVVMEFLSDTDTGEYSIRSIYPYGKFYFYERILCVPTYVLFDPHSVTLEVYRLESDRYIQQEANPEGQYWVPELELFLGVWHGTRLGSTINWLRWWDRNGNLLLWSAEVAEQEHQRAETLANKLRELGIEPNDL